ncbi:PqqD family protein [Leptospira ognonensis]|uniref:PqqD family protein n=1 Tax=Leptospira ognonensis TaxID=2484945 RepID=A0A4R9K8W4_9LEPT|nr:PqqD family protein [Leptospira ognonensis]TGL63067.1 PqqD family protein [Leptospira ognonensis]
MPNSALKNLALSENGFVFDPTSGNTFILNETALTIVKLLIKDTGKEEIFNQLINEYDVKIEEIDRDYADLTIQLREMGLIE